jgi:hypothetical protein
MREIHGLVAGKNNQEVVVTDDQPFVRLSVGPCWQQLTLDEAWFIADRIYESCARIKQAKSDVES